MKVKTELRLQLRGRRAELSDIERATASQAITARAIGIIPSQVTRAHCYRSLEEEVDTGAIITELGKRGIEVDVPPQHAGSPTAEELSRQYGLIIVPMLGFDKVLHRIGYGSGYYDRLLAAHSGAAKIGLCFEAGRVEQLPVEPHDQRLDLVITEDRAYRA
jgi:5-formyltetrahydrofolate cyclo-ligase